MNELTIDGKIYISSKRAAEVTGYAKDYIGQLCREGHVEARMVGRSWYVLESSIRAHRFGGDPHAAPVETENITSNASTHPTDAWEKPTYVPEMAPSMPIPTVQRPVAPVMSEIAHQDAPVDLDTAESLTDMQAAWKEWFAQKQDTLIESPEIIDAREDAGSEEVGGESEETPEEYDREAEIERNIQAFKDAHQDIELAHHEEISASFENAPAGAEEAERVQIQPIHSDPAIQRYEEIEEESEPVLIHHATYQAAEAPRTMASIEETHIPTKKERKQALQQARKIRKARVSRKSGGFGSLAVRAILIALILLALTVTAIGTGYASRFTAGAPALNPVVDFLGGTSTYSK